MISYLEFERGSTRSHSLDNSLWKRPWICHKTLLDDEMRKVSHQRDETVLSLVKICFVLNCLTVKVEESCNSETSVNTACQLIQHNTPEDLKL
jgi:hypothetical protein